MKHFMRYAELLCYINNMLYAAQTQVSNFAIVAPFDLFDLDTKAVCFELSIMSILCLLNYS